ncbi:hypothetical protein HYU09_05195 [Candidatus Woesearchaeota archaeon]|nr:hypothetical protein [Candidatus Woesearchaeota archaeon]
MVVVGKIIKILDEYRVVIDKGYTDGVEKDTIFIIYSEGEIVEDPETKENLGRIEHVKSKIKPLHIQENFTIMETAEKEASTNLTGIMHYLSTSQVFYRKKPLKISADIKKSEQPDDTIKVGDLVRQDLS